MTIKHLIPVVLILLSFYSMRLQAQVILTQNDTLIVIKKGQKEIEMSVTFMRSLVDNCEQKDFNIPRLPSKISRKKDFNKFYHMDFFSSKDDLHFRSFGRRKRIPKRKFPIFRRVIKLKKGEKVVKTIRISVDFIERSLKEEKMDSNEFYLSFHYSSIMLQGYDKTKLSCHSHQGVEYVKVPTKIVME